MLYIILHRNVDVDAIVSAYLYAKVVCFGDKKRYSIITEEKLDKIPDGSEIAVLDMPLKQELQKTIEERNLNLLHHFDHHSEEYSHYPSTAAIIKEELGFDSEWNTDDDGTYYDPSWLEYYVELANACDTAQVIKQPAPIKLFHLSGFINALRTSGYSDEKIIGEVFRILDIYKPMLQKLAEAEALTENIPIHVISDVSVAVVENADTRVNQALFEKGVDLIIFRDGNNLGILRNANVDKPDLTKLKPFIRGTLIDRRAEEEFEEWFFHPAGFIAARGTRKHPAKTPSALTTKDLLNILAFYL